MLVHTAKHVALRDSDKLYETLRCLCKSIHYPYLTHFVPIPYPYLIHTTVNGSGHYIGIEQKLADPNLLRG